MANAILVVHSDLLFFNCVYGGQTCEMLFVPITAAVDEIKLFSKTQTHQVTTL